MMAIECNQLLQLDKIRKMIPDDFRIQGLDGWDDCCVWVTVVNTKYERHWTNYRGDLIPQRYQFSFDLNGDLECTEFLAQLKDLQDEIEASPKHLRVADRC